MSELTLYLKMEKDFEDVASDLGKVFGLDLVVEQTDTGPRCQFYCLDVEFYFVKHFDEEDDGAIEYSKYNYCLFFIKLNSGGYSDEYNDMYTNIAKHYSKKIAHALNAKALLINLKV